MTGAASGASESRPNDGVVCMFDVVLTGGTMIDPVTGAESRKDLAIRAGKVAAVESDLSGHASTDVIDVSGRLVLPGLVDAHSHVYAGVTVIGMEPDGVCLPAGVTATADGGSAGADTFVGFKRYIAQRSRTRVFSFVNLSRLGGTGNKATGELVNPLYADPDNTERILNQHSDVAVGVKLRASTNVLGGSCLPMLKLAKDVTNNAGKPLMVHIGGTSDPISDILARLVAGDIVTHFQTPKANGLLDDSGRLAPAAIEARERGVVFDSGHGRTHFSFDVARRLLDQGLPPDTLSTDMSKSSYANLAPGLLSVMNMWLALGLPLADVVRATTSRSAEILGRTGQFGHLDVGADADIAVVFWQDGKFVWTDAAGDTRTSDRKLAADLTFRAGELVWRRDGFGA